ncbi:alpha/beta-hydrolase [Gyrodon lividus]|nr:alpha/beta-hydrolase [Gyrodon lividus]
MLHALSSVSGGAGGAGHHVVAAPCYRLSTTPENSFPAALQDLIAAYDYLIKASNITLPSLETVRAGTTSDRMLPSGIVTIAPVALHVYTNLSEHAKAQASVDIPPLSVSQAASTMYIGGALIVVGTGDQLIDASRELEKILKSLKRSVELVEYDGLPHGWWTLPRVFPEENLDAVQRIARFIHGDT